MMGYALRRPRLRTLFALLGVALLAACSGSPASFLNDGAAFDAAMSALRSEIGEHPRLLRIEVDASRIAFEAQDPHDRDHVDRWQYGVVSGLAVFSARRLTGPQAVQLQLVNPDLEANLFDLDAVDLSVMPKLMSAAVARARLQNAAAVTRIEIARQTFILPSPTSGDIRWALHVDSGREHAEIYANAQGVVVRADLANTLRAQRLNLVDDPAVVADAAAAFRDSAGAAPVLTKVDISAKTVNFSTNIRDGNMAKLGFAIPATASFTWDPNGLARRLGNIDANLLMGNAGPAPFGVDDVNWSLLAQLERDALARFAVPKARVTGVGIAKSSEQPGPPVLAWTVEITEPGGEVTSVIADAQGAIQRVILPASRRPKLNWLDAATIAAAIERIAPTFGYDAKIASIAFDDRGGRITIDERDNGGRPATFDFSPDGVARAAKSFLLNERGPRFGAADVASLNEWTIGALEAQALNRLGAGRPVYLESVTIGAHFFVQQAGAHAIEVRVRDVAEDSVRAQYAWIVFDFNGRVLDLATF